MNTFMIIKAMSLSFRWEDAPPSHRFRIAVQISSNPYDCVPEPRLPALCSLLDVHGVHGVSLHDKSSLEFVRQLYNPLSHIHSLVFRGQFSYFGDCEDVMSVLNDLLVQTPDPTDQPPSARCNLPRLQLITLESVQFSYGGDYTTRSLVDHLCSFFDARTSIGCPVNALTIKACLNMDEQDVERLQKVTTVSWDGQKRIEVHEVFSDPDFDHDSQEEHWGDEEESLNSVEEGSGTEAEPLDGGEEVLGG